MQNKHYITSAFIGLCLTLTTLYSSNISDNQTDASSYYYNTHDAYQAFIERFLLTE